MSFFYHIVQNPLLGSVLGLGWLMMIIHSARREDWPWVAYMVFLPFMAVVYFFLHFRGAGVATEGFELPGTAKRQRIRELTRLIHDLDKPHHYLELGDIYFQRGKLIKAEENYRASLQRDPKDIDARSHLGQCLLREKRPTEAAPLLLGVCTENPRHDYGHSLMAYAETLTALGQLEGAETVWKQVLANHCYARARVQLGELYLTRGDRSAAQGFFREAMQDDKYAPAFQRRRDRYWIRRAKRGLRH